MLVVYKECFRYDKDEVRNMSFGEKLQQLRKENGLSQEDLAHQLNVSRQAVSKWESQNSYPEMEKIILISELFQVSLDYLMKDNCEKQKNDSAVYYLMSQQKIDDYLQMKKNFALRISSSVAFMIIGLFIAVLCANTSYQVLGIFSFLIMIGMGVFFIILTALSEKMKLKIENKEINIGLSDLQNLQSQYQHFHSYFTIAIAGGVLLIIISLAFIVLFYESYPQYENFIGSQFLLCMAIAIFFFIYFGVMQDAYRFLIDNKAYIEEKKKEQQRDNIYAITMPLAAMIYLIMGFTKNWWHPGWIIFPVTVFISLGIDSFIHSK